MQFNFRPEKLYETTRGQNPVKNLAPERKVEQENTINSGIYLCGWFVLSPCDEYVIAGQNVFLDRNSTYLNRIFSQALSFV